MTDYAKASNFYFSPWLGNGLFNCFDDCTICCVTYWLPCITYAENGQLLFGEQHSNFWTDCALYMCVALFTSCQCILGFARRGELRRKYNLAPVPCNDVLIHWCCHACALCQENRELKARAAVVQSQAVLQQVPLVAGDGSKKSGLIEAEPAQVALL